MHGTHPKRVRRAVWLRRDEFERMMGKLSNAEIARLLDCGESTVSRILTGRTPVSPDVLVALVDLMGADNLGKVVDFGVPDKVAA